MNPLDQAELDWDEQGAPFSRQFQDIYFSREGGLDESRYLYLGQNRLIQRWPEHFAQHRQFSIAETGFGTGLNFLATLQAWRQRPAGSPGCLHYFSFEKYPLTPKDLQRANQQWPDLAAEAELLQAAYPPALMGLQSRWLTETCCLHLYFGDAQQGLAQMMARDGIDAWYLDGFSPAKNADLWSETVLNWLSRHSRAGATLATFTVAGHVRRALVASGFQLSKIPGFDTKKHMLRGEYIGPPTQPRSHFLDWPSQRPASLPIGIIGAGLAGTAVAQALSRRGYRCQLFDQASELASQASGNPIGGFHPALEAGWSLASRYHWQGCLQLLHELTQHPQLEWVPGVFRQAQSDAERQLFVELAQRLGIPKALLRWDPERQGLWLPGGSLSPKALSLSRWQAACRMQPANRLILDSSIERIEPTGDGWLLSGPQQSYPVAHLVLANASAAGRLLPELSPYLSTLRGQISYVPATLSSEPLYCGNKYLTGALQDLRVVGASFSRETALDFRLEEHQQNLALLAQERPDLAVALQQLPALGRVGLRSVSPDHLPLVGPWPEREFWQREYPDLQRGKPESTYPAARYLPRLSLCLGLGARGINQSGLAAEFLAASLTGEPLPLERDLAQALHPARFWLKSLKRGHALP